MLYASRLGTETREVGLMQDEGSDDMRPAPGGRGEGAATRPRRVNAGAKGRGWADEASWESSGETASSTSPVRHPAKRRAGRPLVESSDEVCTTSLGSGHAGVCMLLCGRSSFCRQHKGKTRGGSRGA